MQMSQKDLGTDFYNEKLEKVKTVPYKHNYGYLFTSGPKYMAWYGKEKKLLKKGDAFKSIMLHLKLIGKSTKHFAAM